MAQPHNTASLPRWPALVGGGFLNVALGTYYAWSVFVPVLEKEFGFSRTEMSFVSTINMVMLAVMYNIAGTLIGRFGARTIAVIGGICFSAGMFLASFSNSLTALYLTAGVLVGLGLGFGYLPPISVGFKWFPEARGLVSGLAVGIFAAGSGVIGPVVGGFEPFGWGGLIEKFGWRETFQILASVYFVLTMIGAYWLKDPPEGYNPGVVAKAKSTATKVSSVNLTTAQMLRIPSFYPLWIAYVFGCVAGTMTISQVVPFARSAGFSATAAAFAITIGAAGSALGRFFSGWMSDHMGRLLTVRIILVLSFFAAPALYFFRESVPVFYVLLFIVYYAYGTQLSVYTALAGDFYGPKHSAANYGILLLAWGVAGIFGPMLGGRVFTATGSYQMAFYLAAAAALASLALLIVAKPPTEAQLQAIRS
jgi:OFA family oxalate/formate antiporter-like MFS transporter